MDTEERDLLHSTALQSLILDRLARNVFNVPANLFLFLPINYSNNDNNDKKAKSKVIPVTGLGGLEGCEMLRIPHCVDNRLIDSGKAVSLTHPPQFTPQKHYYFYVSGTHFC
jgi:hypothetical protein